MTNEEGLNLAGVETVLEMEARVERMRAEMSRMRKRATEMEARMNEELERLRAARGGELVPYGAYERLTPGRGTGARVKVPISASAARAQPAELGAARSGAASAGCSDPRPASGS